MTKIAIIIGSTRPHRKAHDVARWVHDIAAQRADATYELVDIADLGLPLLDEAVPPLMAQYANAHTRRWADTVRSFDGFVFVTPEYNHSIPGALKNAIDFLYAEWNNKAAGFVSYGSAGGARAVEHLRTVLAELQVATVRSQVMLNLFHDFKDMQEFTPLEHHGPEVDAMLDQVVAWSGALAPLRLEHSAADDDEQSAA